jgi:hypothetical protein
MEKSLQEEEIKELEEEIDLAVDQLFVEKRKGAGETLFQEVPDILPSFEPPQSSKKRIDVEPRLAPPLEPPAPPPPPKAPPSPTYLKSIDQLEAHLLSLEWEISEEKVAKTQEAVKVLRNSLKQRQDVGSVLGFMKDLLDRMKADEENIRPPMIKFLLDAKETVKLLLRQETESEFAVYKKLALDGIEARFGGLAETKAAPSQAAPLAIEQNVDSSFLGDWKKEEEVSRWNAFFEKTEEILGQINERLSRLEKAPRASLAPSKPEKERPPVMDITVCRASGKWVGVESQRIWRLFKVPASFQEQCADHPRVRIRDKDVSMIDLEKIFPGESSNPEGAIKLLMIQGEGEYKGLIVEDVLKRIEASPEERGGDGKPLLGIVHWSYQAHPIDVPILDFARL